MLNSYLIRVQGTTKGHVLGHASGPLNSQSAHACSAKMRKIALFKPGSCAGIADVIPCGRK